MLVSVLPVPFADAARQRQYEAVLAALRAEAGAPATVLLGNLAAFKEVPADALIVRPDRLALLVLTPRAGHLTVPALTFGTWQLDGQPLPGRASSENPFAQYQQQLPQALTWLSEQLNLPEDELPPCLGIALFEAPLTFGPGVEAQLHRHAAGHDFQLVGGASPLTARLRQHSATEPAVLQEDELLEWGEYLANEPYVAYEQGTPENLVESLAPFLRQKLRQLWRWLGAEDIPADPPYGGPPPDQHLRDQQEQARLRQLRQELQAELHQQRQEAARREAARTQELALLRQQLTQAGPSAAARRAEEQAKAAVEESLRLARAELATRNQELDAHIQQLGQLIEQLQAAPAAPPAGQPAEAQAPASKQLVNATPAPRPVAAAKRPRPIAASAWSFRRLRQAERWGLVLLATAGVGVGTWGVMRWAHQPAPGPATVAQRRLAENLPLDTPPDNPPGEFADSLAAAQAAVTDTLSSPTTEAAPIADETELTTEKTEPAAAEVDTPAAPTPTTTETTTPAEQATPDTAPAPSPVPTEPETSPTP